MLTSPIDNALYGCKNWRLAESNTNRIAPDAQEPDATEPDAAEPDTPEENLLH